MPGVLPCFASLGAGIALRNSVCTEVDGIVRFDIIECNGLIDVQGDPLDRVHRMILFLSLTCAFFSCSLPDVSLDLSLSHASFCKSLSRTSLYNAFCTWFVP